MWAASFLWRLKQPTRWHLTILNISPSIVERACSWWPAGGRVRSHSGWWWESSSLSRWSTSPGNTPAWTARPPEERQRRRLWRRRGGEEQQQPPQHPLWTGGEPKSHTDAERRLNTGSSVHQYVCVKSIIPIGMLGCVLSFYVAMTTPAFILVVM